ncbi:M23 family metallopeptidase [Comamonas sp. NoAH]|uniref:M23 family metallopeptidase n=1 Tax=Comamonas halotolerans TaxID=3041496 RepID=UPI0024E07DDC|nr:M23 family metallopeptidase [Comamonas sp. NoAH]
MIISPPFLSRTDTAVYDEQCVRSVMSGGILGSGGFPLGQAMVWHGGAHITAPNANEPVRAIADGIVIFRREGGTAEYDGQPHSTGCVVIRHTTEIGADPGTNGATAVEVTYYSIYQHLRKLDAALPALNQPIYRKDKLGLAGDIHGQPNRIHLEIIAGDADTQKLVGRNTAELPLNQDGRSNTVYGQLYVLLPAQSVCHATQPGNSPLPIASGDSGDADLIIGIQYEQGHATLTTYQLTGEIVGSAPVETDAEYRLYAEANQRHAALSPNERANSSPSGWYELLRFGRNLGPDPLPAHAEHWRKVVLPSHPQGAWVNLNAAGTYKFSDADFPHWMGWKLIDDDTEDNNSQCNSALIDAMLSPAAQPKTAPAGPPSLIGPSTPPPQAPETAQTTPEQRAANRLQNLCKPDVQEKLAKTICKFPTEWAKNELRSRWAWIKAKGNPYMPFPLDDEEFEKVVTFAEKLCFWEDLPQEDRDRLTFTHWHFHPREFIAHFRKCGWLSEDELAQTFPRYFFYEKSGNKYIAHKTGNPNIYQINSTQAKERIGNYRLPLCRVMRKYLISNPQRITMFLAQIFLETDRWRTMEEYGYGAENKNIPMAKYYSAFYGRGVMQLTWAGNYDDYGKYRSKHALPDVPNGRYNDRLQRINTTSTHYFADPTLRDKKGVIIGVSGTARVWFPRYDPSTVKNDPYAACDSGGFYWVSRSTGNKNININRVCDRAFDGQSIGRVNVLVNGGGNGYFDRQAYSQFIFRSLSDSVEEEVAKEYVTPRGIILVDFSRIQ